MPVARGATTLVNQELEEEGAAFRAREASYNRDQDRHRAAVQQRLERRRRGGGGVGGVGGVCGGVSLLKRKSTPAFIPNVGAVRTRTTTGRLPSINEQRLRPAASSAASYISLASHASSASLAGAAPGPAAPAAAAAVVPAALEPSDPSRAQMLAALGLGGDAAAQGPFASRRPPQRQRLALRSAAISGVRGRSLYSGAYSRDLYEQIPLSPTRPRFQWFFDHDADMTNIEEEGPQEDYY